MITQSALFKNFTIEYSEERQFKLAEYALSKIGSKPIGFSMLIEMNNMAKGETKINIFPNKEGGSATGMMLTESQFQKYPNISNLPDVKWKIERAKTIVADKSIGGEGQPTSAFIVWNTKEANYVSDTGKNARVEDEKMSFVTLAHELVHAYWIMKGKALGIKPDINGVHNMEEWRAIGINNFLNDRFTENNIRREHGLPLRLQYAGENFIR